MVKIFLFHKFFNLLTSTKIKKKEKKKEKRKV